jgi:PIN domain nuclease of toxin-antitoxin system
LGGDALILLDTHVLVWLMLEPARLSRRAASAIRRARASGGIAIAAMSLWEIAMMFSRGQITPRGSVEASVRRLVEEAGVEIRSITPEIAALAWQFPDDFSRDPADRLIAATARAEGTALVTRDERLRQCRLVKTIW